MDRHGHVMPGMDAVYLHVTPEMRQQLCDYLQQLWQQGIAERYTLAPRSAVPLLDGILIAHEKSFKANASKPTRRGRPTYSPGRDDSRLTKEAEADHEADRAPRSRAPLQKCPPNCPQDAERPSSETGEKGL
jgi:hypothetical protein